VDESASDFMQLDSFKLTLGNIADIELDRLHALSTSVGWPHRAEDLQFLRDFGKGVVALDDIGRILGSAMWFPYGGNFATIGMVITSPRLQANGAGQWLMNHILDQVKDRDIGLNATRVAHRLYLSLDFKPEATVYQCQGEALDPPQMDLPPDTALRAIEPGDLDAVSVLDEAAFGADRKPLLARLLPHSKGLALIRHAKIEAFSFCRPFGRGQVVGPVVAMSDTDAISVVRPHVVEHAGRFLRLDTREKGGAFAEFIARCNLPIFDTVTTMSLGRRWPVSKPGEVKSKPHTFALAGQAIG
jgi:GNAT superfamily N-acetyltransferase